MVIMFTIHQELDVINENAPQKVEKNYPFLWYVVQNKVDVDRKYHSRYCTMVSYSYFNFG